MKRLTPAEGRERRKRYCELRRQGTGVIEAALAVGLGSPSDKAELYERWFQAAERGEQIVVQPFGSLP